MSSVEFAEKRGLQGMPVATKAELYTDPCKRSLLLFLRAMSARPGGIEKVAADVLEMFPERIGSSTMHRLGMKPDRNYDTEAVKSIRAELNIDRWLSPFPLRGEHDESEEPLTDVERRSIRLEVKKSIFSPEGFFDELIEERVAEMETSARRAKAEMLARQHPTHYPASAFVRRCDKTARQNLPRLLWEYCTNPKIRLSTKDESPASVGSDEYLEGDLRFWNTETASLAYFHDLTGALLEYKARHEAQARVKFAETAISKSVFGTLDRGLRSRKIVVVQGVEGVGKSFSGQAWNECHLGEAVFVRLEGIVTKTTFFQSLSSACGLASSVSQKSQEMQIRIRHFLERSGLMLIIDEAHRLFQQTERIYSHPELLNWVYTCWDQKIPVALLVTPQFVSRMDEVERQTDWRSGQLKRRIAKWTRLPEKLAEEDLQGIARNIAPRYTAAMLGELVDFALPSRRQIDAMRNAMEAAESIAEEKGRKTPTFQDLLDGIADAQLTDQAMTTPLDRKRQSGGPTGGKRKGRRMADASPLHDDCSELEPGADSGDATEFTRTVTPSRGRSPQMAEPVLG